MSCEQKTADTAPKVSVIIIFLNPGKYLDEAIESVFAQTSDDWELLLCDDGSTDVGTDIARRYAEKYPDKVRYLEHPGHENRGMSATRNLGIDNARGEFISWLDADDVWLPSKVAEQSALLDEHEAAAMVFGPVELWYSWTGLPEDHRRDFIQDVGLTPDRMIHPPELITNFLVSDMRFCTGVMIRKAILNEIGNYEEDFRGAFEDIITHCKLGLRHPVYFSSKTWYRYRQHPDQYCEDLRRARGKRNKRVIFLDRLMQHMQAHGLDGKFPDLLATVRAQHRRYAEHWRFFLGDATKRGAWLAAESVRAALRNTRKVGERVLPQRLRGVIGELWYGKRSNPPRGWVHFGNLRRTKPLSSVFGWDRGRPIDRYYIENFLDQNKADIRGEVMEIAEPKYTTQFGGDRVTTAHVMHVAEGNPQATFVGDLTSGLNVPTAAYDCVILTQVLPFLWDFEKAIEHTAGSLKPGGVLLLTVPGISQVSLDDAERWGDYWRFTRQSLEKLLRQQFPDASVEVEAYGNVLSACGMLMGLATEELTAKELDARDPAYEVSIVARAVKPIDTPSTHGADV